MHRSGGVFDVELIDHRSGFISIAVAGQGATLLFKDEPGGHRWQRIPPTEKRGRVHTSTVTVAVLEPFEDNADFNVRDVEIQTTRGSGPGGQNRNKVESCVVATHKPTNITVRIDMKSQQQSRALAMKILSARVLELKREAVASERSNTRQTQVGSGMRGDKVRTYRMQDDQVADHRNGKKWQLAKWMKGDW